LVCVDEEAYLKGIERLMGQKINKVIIKKLLLKGMKLTPSRNTSRSTKA